MELDIKMAEAQENIEEQKEAHVENVVQQMVLDAVHERIDQAKSTVVEMAIENDVIDEATLDEHLEQIQVQVENDDASLNAMIPDLLNQLDYLEDLSAVVANADVTASNQLVFEDLVNVNANFAETLLAQPNEENAVGLQDLENDNQELFQQLINQQAVFETERENQEAALFANLNMEDPTFRMSILLFFLIF